MYILAIETTGAFASAALAKAGNRDGKLEHFEILGHVQGHDRFSHLQNLTLQIEEVIEKSELSIGDIDVIAVSNGPGSFTGIRIGVSTARALAQALGIPCVAVSSLRALAMRAAPVAERGNGSGGRLICPIFDARRGQVYGGGFFLDTVIGEGAYTIEEFMKEVSASGFKEAVFMGDGIDVCRERIEELKGDVDVEYAPEEIRYQDAETVARLGAELACAGKTCAYGELKPEYMRAAEAERKLKEKRRNG